MRHLQRIPYIILNLSNVCYDRNPELKRRNFTIELTENIIED